MTERILFAAMPFDGHFNPLTGIAWIGDAVPRGAHLPTFLVGLALLLGR